MPRESIAQVLLVGGIDPTGHAGLFRDAWVCDKLHVPYFLYPTALTAQNDKKYFGTQIPSTDFFRSLEKAMPLNDIGVVKIGMLASAQVVKRVVALIQKIKNFRSDICVIWDPVFYSSSGGELLSAEGRALAIQSLLPLCNLVTPNALEMPLLLGLSVRVSAAPEVWTYEFVKRFSCAVYLKGGHLRQKSIDYFQDEYGLKVLSSKTSAKQMRGTGCALATMIACYLVRGENLLSASQKAKRMMSSRIFR